MELPVILLAVLVVAIATIGWIRERRTWHTIFASPARDPEQALQLHRDLQDAGIRSRYKLAHTGLALHQAHSSLTQTAEVQVHRDDLGRAHAVRIETRQRGGGGR